MKVELTDHLTPADVEMLKAIAWTIVNARYKYPGPAGRYVAFTAEAGEAFHAVQKLITGRGTAGELQAELIQAAAMAVRLATEGDSHLNIPALEVTP